MNVLLVVPGWPPSGLWGQMRFKFPPLNLLTLASSTPKDVEISIIDENLERMHYKTDADLVGITVMTPQAPRAYKIGDEFRSRRRKVVLGGFHVSHLPEEALNHANALFQEMACLKFKWASHALLNFADDEELLKLAYQSGCVSLFVGFESLSPENLSIMEKESNLKTSPTEAIKKFHDHRIGGLASFVLGYDYDTPNTFKKILDFCLRTQIDGGLFPILTPYPGTCLRERLKKEGRILTDPWDLYDMEHVTFLPKGMSPEELQEGFEWLKSSFLSWRGIK